MPFRRLPVDPHRTVFTSALVGIPASIPHRDSGSTRSTPWLGCSSRVRLSAPVSLTRFQVSKHPRVSQKRLCLQPCPASLARVRLEQRSPASTILSAPYNFRLPPRGT